MRIKHLWHRADGFSRPGALLNQPVDELLNGRISLTAFVSE